MIHSVLVDNCVNHRVVDVASEHMPAVAFTTADDAAVTHLENGDLHRFAADSGYDAILTCDVRMPEQTIPCVPTVVFHVRPGTTADEILEIGVDCAGKLASVTEIKYHPVHPREGSTGYRRRAARVRRIERLGLRPDSSPGRGKEVGNTR